MYYRPAPAPRGRRRLSRRAIIIIIVAAAAGALGLLYFFDLLPALPFSSSQKELDMALPETVTASDHGILYNHNNTLHLLDMEGKEEWSLDLELSEAETVTSNQAIINYAGKTVQAMNFNKEQLFKTSLDGEIERVAVGQSSVAVQSVTKNEAEETQVYIHLFNLKGKGEQTGQIETPENQVVVDFGFHGENDVFWVLMLDVSGVVPISSVTTYKLDGSQTNSILINSEIIEDVYMTDSAIFTSGTATLSSYTYFSTKQDEKSIYGWHVAASSVYPDAIKLAYVPRSRSAEIDTVHIYSTDLTKVHFRLPRNVFSVALTQNHLYAFTEKSVYVYTMAGALDKEIPLSKEITRVKQISDSVAILWDNQKSYLMNLS